MYLKGTEIQSILNGSYLYVFVIFIVLLSILIIALTKNVYKSFRSFGIVLGISGCITIIASEAISMILLLFASELREYIAIINSVVNTFMEKLEFAGYLEIAIGIVLLIFSVIIKKIRNNVQNQV